MLNVALIGFGYWGGNVARNIHNNPNLNLYCICDAKKDSIERAQSIYINQTKYESNYKKLLNDKSIDAIAIVTQTSLHYKIVKEALLSGKHVYVEKPFTSDAKEAIELEKIAKKMALNIHINHIMIFNSNIQKIKEIINSKDFGEILYIDSTRANLGQIKKDTTSMLDLAIHDLAIIDYLSDGKEPKYVDAFGGKFYNPKESVTFLNLKYNGFIAHIESNWLSPLKERKMIVVGTKKMLVYDDMKMGEKISLYDKHVEELSGKSINSKDYSIALRDGDVYSPYVKQDDALYNSLEHFRESITNRRDSISNPAQAIRLMKILDRADESRRKRK